MAKYAIECMLTVYLSQSYGLVRCPRSSCRLQEFSRFDRSPNTIGYLRSSLPADLLDYEFDVV